MKRFFVGQLTSSGANGYSGVVLSSNTEIRQLTGVARQLNQQDDPMLDPEFFLASVSKGWQPKIVAVSYAHEVIGMVYTKERVIHGIPTGVVSYDGSLGSSQLGNPLDQQNSFGLAMETLLRSSRIRGVRLRLLPCSDELEVTQQLISSGAFDARDSQIKSTNSSTWKDHAHLPLAGTYEQFLKGVGYTTRHNFRYYRRRFEASGHGFVERLSVEKLRSVALDLLPKSKVSSWRARFTLETGLNMVAAASRPLAIGLKHHNGEWLSVIGGWYRPRSAILCFQCNNDRDFSRDSLSVVLRAYLLELLIRQGLEELVIWGGTGPPLSRYVTYVPTIGVRLDAPTHLWRGTRRIISTVGPLLPKRLAAAAQWVA
jgi:hypothetical protein